jgi:hypothetical protein
MSKLKFKLNRRGVGGLLKSSAMESVLMEKATAAQSRLMPGYEVSSMVGKTRANASIYADSFKAKLDNQKNNSILKALR